MPKKEHTSETPKLLPIDYKDRYPAPCTKLMRGFQAWYLGSGIPAGRHPLAGKIDFKESCSACKSKNIKIIAAQHNINIMNGDEYYDYEACCEDCGTFTAVAYSDNS